MLSRAVAILVATTMVGRFLISAFVRPEWERRKSRLVKEQIDEDPAKRSFIRRNANTIAVLALFLYPIAVVSLAGSQGSLRWVDNFGIQILIYVMLAWGLNIAVGLAILTYTMLYLVWIRFRK